VGGKLTCVGGMPPVTEVCDGLDNNCNGTTDEDPNGDLCPGGSTC